MKLKKLLAFLIIFPFIMTGCWDNVDIDRRVFVSTIAIDIGKDIEKEKELKNIKPDVPFQERELRKIKVTFGFPNISKLGPGKGTVYEEQNIAAESYSMSGAISIAVSKSSRNLYFGHSKLLLLSDEILRHPETVKEFMDYFQREPKLNRMMYVAVVDGLAEEYIKAKPSMEQNIESYLKGIMENSSSNATILPVTLNEFLILLSESGNALLPRLSFDKSKNEMYLSGVGLIKNYNLIGYMNTVETSDVEMLRGKLKGGKKVIFLNGHPIDYVITELKRKIKLVSFDGKKLKFNVDINMEGNIAGYYVLDNVFGGNKLDKIEGYFDKSLSEESEKVIKITQNEFQIDPIGFREYLKKFKPSVWKQVENNWSTYYKKAEVNVNCTSHIRRIGVSK